MSEDEIDWDDAYANAAYIEGGEHFPKMWAREAAVFRKLASHDLDIPFGERPRERYDLFFPEGDAKGLFVFIHGGYWLSFDKSHWSHFAAGATAQGWTVMMPSYDLCPDVPLSSITLEIGAAINHAAKREAGPIVIAGHSAGGHLAARMMCEDAPLEPDVAARVRRAVGISGLYDLRPLQKTKMNDKLHITDDVAAAESPVLLAPRAGAEIVVWVGAEERPAFVRQSKDFTGVWAVKGAALELNIEVRKHHFDVIESLADPRSEMIKSALAD